MDPFNTQNLTPAFSNPVLKKPQGPPVKTFNPLDNKQTISRSRETCRVLFRDAFLEDKALQGEKEAISDVVARIETEIYQQSNNNENSKTYRDKINGVKVRIKGDSSHSIRAAILNNTLSIEDLIKGDVGHQQDNVGGIPKTSMPQHNVFRPPMKNSNIPATKIPGPTKYLPFQNPSKEPAKTEFQQNPFLSGKTEYNNDQNSESFFTSLLQPKKTESHESGASLGASHKKLEEISTEEIKQNIEGKALNFEVQSSANKERQSAHEEEEEPIWDSHLNPVQVNEDHSDNIPEKLPVSTFHEKPAVAEQTYNEETKEKFLESSLKTDPQQHNELREEVLDLQGDMLENAENKNEQDQNNEVDIKNYTENALIAQEASVLEEKHQDLSNAEEYDKIHSENNQYISNNQRETNTVPYLENKEETYQEPISHIHENKNEFEGPLERSSDYKMEEPALEEYNRWDYQTHEKESFPKEEPFVYQTAGINEDQQAEKLDLLNGLEINKEGSHRIDNLNDLNDFIRELKHVTIQKDHELNIFKNKLAEADALISHTENEQSKALSKMNSEHKNREQALEKEISHKKAEISRLSASISELEKSLEESQLGKTAECSKLTAKISELEKALEGNQLGKSTEIASLQIRISELEEQLKGAETARQRESKKHEEAVMKFEVTSKGSDNLEGFTRRIKDEFHLMREGFENFQKTSEERHKKSLQELEENFKGKLNFMIEKLKISEQRELNLNREIAILKADVHKKEELIKNHLIKGQNERHNAPALTSEKGKVESDHAVEHKGVRLANEGSASHAESKTPTKVKLEAGGSNNVPVGHIHETSRDHAEGKGVEDHSEEKQTLPHISQASKQQQRNFPPPKKGVFPGKMFE